VSRRGLVAGAGCGCARILPHLDFDAIRRNPKVLIHVKPPDVPAWRGALVGHIDRQFTLPLGADVEIDATAGSIRMLTSAVR
jgi:muramoyltetrapeptide carboxypeptidase